MADKIAYKRVSSKLQNTERQLESIEFDKEFIEKASAGHKRERPVLDEFITSLRNGDEAHVHSLDRLGRSVIDLKNIVDRILEKGASLHIHKENLIFKTGQKSNPAEELMLNILSSFAQFERSIIRERQAEGIAIAKEKGVYEGRKSIHSSQQREEIVLEANQSDLFGPRPTKQEICKKYKISRSTLLRYEREVRERMKSQA